MVKLLRSKILDEVTVCPYCMNPARGRVGCCGEASTHFETAYDTGEEYVLDSEVEIIEDEASNG